MKKLHPNYYLEPVVCDCNCHTTPGMMHFAACCQGTCPECRQGFIVGLHTHMERCGVNMDEYLKKMDCIL